MTRNRYSFGLKCIEERDVRNPNHCDNICWKCIRKEWIDIGKKELNIEISENINDMEILNYLFNVRYKSLLPYLTIGDVKLD